MPRYPHLLNRNGTFYVRVVVPKALAPYIGRRELASSLRTKDRSEAALLSLPIVQAANALFERMRKGETLSTLDLLQCVQRPKQPLPPLAPLTQITPHQLDENHAGNLSGLFGQYLSECRTDRAKTKQKKQAVLRVWLEVIGDMPVDRVEKATARAFKQTLIRIPANMHKYFPGMKVTDINLDALREDQRLSVRSINGMLAFFRAFMNWCIDNGHYHKTNPFDGLLLREVQSAESKRNSFTQEQINQIFTCPVYTGCKSHKMHDRYLPGQTVIRDSLYWIPLVALYSGARLQEIAQLYVHDVHQIGGLWVFDFNEEGEDKYLKTVSSRRKTPMHPALVNLGFLGYLEGLIDAGEKRVFPDLSLSSDGTYSNSFSKRFNYLLKRQGIKTAKSSFHSFRHTFIDALRNTEVAREVREALVGHLGQRTAHDVYGSSIGLQRLFTGLCEVKFTGGILPVSDAATGAGTLRKT